MYAVIRAGGKQYRVAPGDVIRVETQDEKDGKVQFGDVLRYRPKRQHCAGRGGSQRERRSGGAGPRREDSGLPLQAQEAI